MNEAQQVVYVNKKKNRKLKKASSLIFITGITAIILIVETYAWFVGLGTATVNAFTIGVSSGDTIELSLDGTNWSDSLTLSREAILGTASSGIKAYSGNTNKFLGDDTDDDQYGLYPLSTDGIIDTTVSRLKLYSVSSITATDGGYRLMTDRINNYGSAEGGGIVSEGDGYVAFDLFIRNGTGSFYTTEYNEEDDEDIYLTSSSAVTVESAGNPDFGLGNSVRVAFSQIGRVNTSTSDASTITSMTCSTTETSVTSLCSNVDTVIWEPNDTKHDTNLVSYFSQICKNRTVSEGVSTYDSTCNAVTDGTYTQTYVVNRKILSSDEVDIYDGLNTYTGTIYDPSVTGSDATHPLTKESTFTDTDKVKTASNREEIFKLAANSITKIRVYIYLEGQDVDNYDLISNGKAIKVTFGFTKNKYDLSAS